VLSMAALVAIVGLIKRRKLRGRSKSRTAEI
jgi:hypothetical protein